MAEPQMAGTEKTRPLGKKAGNEVTGQTWNCQKR